MGWVRRELFEPVEGVFGGNDGGDGDVEEVVEGVARCEFERVLFRVPAPGKTLRAVGDGKGGEVCLSSEVNGWMRC